MLKSGMLLPPGRWCTVTLEDDGLRWELPKNESDVWRHHEFEVEHGKYRTRLDDGDWSEWKPVLMVGEVAHLPLRLCRS